MLLATDSRATVLVELTPAAMNCRAYTPYGFQHAQRPAGSALGFNGERRETPTGWYHLGHGRRVYNPVLMRFHSPDALSPFGKGGINSYAYCQGDPINFTDPTGQFIEVLFNAVKIFKDAVRHTRNVTQAFFRTTSHTHTSRLYQAGYITMGTGAVMYVAGSASGAVVWRTGNIIVAATGGAEYAGKVWRDFGNSRFAQHVTRRFAPVKQTDAALESVMVHPRNRVATSVDKIRSSEYRV